MCGNGGGLEIRIHEDHNLLGVSDKPFGTLQAEVITYGNRAVPHLLHPSRSQHDVLKPARGVVVDLHMGHDGPKLGVTNLLKGEAEFFREGVAYPLQETDEFGIVDNALVIRLEGHDRHFDGDAVFLGGFIHGQSINDLFKKTWANSCFKKLLAK